MKSALLFSLLFVAHASAATMYFLSDAQMCKMAGAIVVGNVAEVTAFIPLDRPQVRTRVRLEVVEYVKAPAEPKAELEILVPGGVTRELVTQRPGAPRFEKGEKVLVFLAPSGDAWRVIGMTRGKYSVLPAGPGESETVRLDLDGLTQLDPETGQEVPADLIPAAAGRVYLADLVATLKASIEAGR
jgi:hypothetical protein